MGDNMYKFNTTFSLHKRQKTDNAVIRMRVTWNNQRTEIDLPVHIKKENWNAKNQELKKGCTTEEGYGNMELDEMKLSLKKKCSQIFEQFAREGSVPSRRLFLFAFRSNSESYKGNNQNGSSFNLNDVIENYIKYGKTIKNWSNGTVKQYTAILSKIQQYKKNPSLDILEEKKLYDYYIFLHQVKKLNNSTISTHLVVIKTFIKWAAENGYPIKLPEKINVRLKKSKNPVVFLTKAEIEIIKNCKLKSPRKIKFRDIFVFCCHTGLRFSDAVNLKKANINIQNNYFEIMSIKTGCWIKIEFNRSSREIAEKYMATDGELLFSIRKTSISEYNIFLKQLCRDLGFDEKTNHTVMNSDGRTDTVVPKWKMIGSHTARRSFICNALICGIPANIVMKWTGHTSLASFMRYVDANDAVKAEAMKRFDDFI